MSKSNSLPVIRSKAARSRIHLMDELRGFAVFCMIFYHAFYTMAFLFRIPLGTELLTFFMPAEPFFAGLFIFISGISSQLSHSNLARGFKLLAVALAVTAVTLFVVPDERIVFGILHMLSVCMILFGLLQKPMEKLPLWAGILATALLFYVTFPVTAGLVGFWGINGLPVYFLPQARYQLPFLFPIGICNVDFYSSDYFPLLPWLFLFFCGTFWGRYARRGQFPKCMYRSRVPFLSWMGRHALILYLVHQPVIYGILLAVQWLVNLF